jgi:hypothetical protein
LPCDVTLPQEQRARENLLVIELSNRVCLTTVVCCGGMVTVTFLRNVTASGLVDEDASKGTSGGMCWNPLFIANLVTTDFI